MKISYIGAGAAGMICGNCLRDSTLAAALNQLGHDVELIPTYTPIRTDEPYESARRVFYGGINVFLQQKSAFFRRSPALLDWLLDRPTLLRWVSRFAVKTQPEDLGELTVSVLEGSGGMQRKELGKLVDALGSRRPQIVHLTNSMFAGFAPDIKAALGVPVVCSLQGEDYFLSHLPEPYNQRAFEVLKRMAPAVDLFIAPSRDHAAVMAPLLGIPEREIRVVRPGLNLAGFQERHPRDSNEFVIGYLARISHEKGLHTLADAFLKLREKRGGAPRVKLRVAGWLGGESVSYFAEVEKKLKAAGDDYEHLGNIDRLDKIRFLRGLDVLSVPVSYRAPKGAYVLEAWACGVPVVQPAIGAFPELLDATGGGILVAPESVGELVEAFEHMIANPEEANKMGLLGKQAVDGKFNSRRLAEQTTALYESLLAGKSIAEERVLSANRAR